MTDIQAALGLSQLKRLDEFVRRRRLIAKKYTEFFEGLEEVETIQENESEYHSYHLYVIKVDNSDIRRKLFSALASNGIYCQVHYIPIYWHPYYRANGYKDEHLPKAEHFYDRILSLPMYPSLTDSQLEFVMDSIRRFFRHS